MNFTKTMFALAIGSVGITGAMSAHAVDANNFAFIGGGSTVNGGASAPTGSWFSMLAVDTNEDYIPDQNVYTGLRAAGGTGIPGPIGTLNMDTAQNVGLIVADTSGGTAHNSGNNITKDWLFFGSWGTDFTTGALEITGSGTATRSVNMSDWHVTWNGIPDINMGGPTGVGTLNSNNSIWGDGDDTLDYSAVVPAGDPSGFGGTNYSLHMVGSMNLAPIPEASTYGMMLAGLGLVGFAVRRRKQVI